MADKHSDLYDKAIELSKGFDEHFLELARVLRQLKQIDAEQFRLCIENSAISRRKAYYLLAIEEIFSKLKVPEPRLLAIGWPKLQVIAKHVKEGNLKSALTLAEKSKIRDLKMLIKGKSPENRPRCVLMYLTDEQYEEFAEVVLQFGAKKSGRGLTGKEDALSAFIKSHKKLVASIAANMAGKA